MLRHTAPCLAVGLLLFALPLSADQKPIVESPIIGEYQVPQTLDALTKRSDAIVIGRVVAIHDRSNAQTRRAKTDYEFRVTHTLKEHHNLGPVTTVCRPIGDIEYEDRVVRQFQPQFARFSEGADYLLFLRWDARNECFAPAFGPPSGAQIDVSRGAKPFVNHPALAELAGLDAARVAERIAQRSK
jgi:hypothetical protein